MTNNGHVDDSGHSAKGVMSGGGRSHFRLRSVAVDFFDRSQYSLVSEIEAYYPDIDLKFFGEEYSCLWTKNQRRLIAYAGGWVAITNPLKVEVIRDSNLATFQRCIYNVRLNRWL